MLIYRIPYFKSLFVIGRNPIFVSHHISMSQNVTQSDILSAFNIGTNQRKRRHEVDGNPQACAPVSKKLLQCQNDTLGFLENIEKEVQLCSYTEVLKKLKHLFASLSEAFPDQRQTFVSLSAVLPTQNVEDSPIVTETSKYFAKEENIHTETLKDAASQDSIQECEVPTISTFQTEKHVPQPIPSLLTSSPIKKQLVHTTFTEQRRHIHLATQHQINRPLNTVSSVKHVKTITLSKEQEMVAELARLGENIFYTGSAGTGKSLLLKTLIENLRKQHGMESIGVTASTGLAAYNIGGMTINSYTGIGLGTGTVQEIVTKIKRNKKAKSRWGTMKVLIIDEISMIDGELIDKLDGIARRLRDKDKPFGGIQVIFCGDFYQLPPVSKTGTTSFAFESKFWKRFIKVQVILTQVFRQASDKQFLQMLQEIRDGDVSESTKKKFKALERPLQSIGNLIPTKLFSTRREVDISNNEMLKKLDGNSLRFDAIDSGSLAGEPQGQKMLENFLAPKTITLKVGAQVMMIKNVDETLVNGSLGTVIGFANPSTYEHYKDILEEVDGKSDIFGRIKATGNFNDLEDSIFDFLAESKKLILEDLKINQKASHHVENSIEVDISQPSLPEGDSNYTEGSIDNNSQFSEFDDMRLRNIMAKEELLRALKSNENPVEKVPVVCFRLSNGSSRTVAIERESFKIEDNYGKVLVSRTQFPLMLAWALSIHKSQGQTLKFVSVDLRRIFENGQAYVALSRAEHRRGLQVLNFMPDKITTNPKVIEFYKRLVDASTALDKLNSKSANTSMISENLDRDLGPNTQLRNLEAISASPERFAKYAKKSSNNETDERKGVYELLRATSIRKSNNLSDNSQNQIVTDEQLETTKAYEIMESDISKLSSDMLKSEDETESFQKIFGS